MKFEYHKINLFFPAFRFYSLQSSLPILLIWPCCVSAQGWKVSLASATSIGLRSGLEDRTCN